MQVNRLYAQCVLVFSPAWLKVNKVLSCSFIMLLTKANFLGCPGVKRLETATKYFVKWVTRADIMCLRQALRIRLLRQVVTKLIPVWRSADNLTRKASYSSKVNIVCIRVWKKVTAKEFILVASLALVGHINVELTSWAKGRSSWTCDDRRKCENLWKEHGAAWTSYSSGFRESGTHNNPRKLLTA